MQPFGSIRFNSSSNQEQFPKTRNMVTQAMEEIPNKKRDISVEIEESLPPKEAGEETAKKDLAKGFEMNNAKFQGLPKSTNRVLYKLKAVILFDLFPDELIIDIDKVTIVYKYFFASEQIHSVKIGDISDVLVETSPFLSVLKIVDRGFVENSINIEHLITEQAMKARRIIQGLIIIKERGVDLTPFSNEEIIEKAEELGKSRSD